MARPSRRRAHWVGVAPAAPARATERRRAMSPRGKTASLLMAALVIAALPFVFSEPAAHAIAGPDAYGYRAITSADTYGPPPGPFTSIVATGSDIGNHCDDCIT